MEVSHKGSFSNSKVEYSEKNNMKMIEWSIYNLRQMHELNLHFFSILKDNSGLYGHLYLELEDFGFTNNKIESCEFENVIEGNDVYLNRKTVVQGLELKLI